MESKAMYTYKFDVAAMLFYIYKAALT